MLPKVATQILHHTSRAAAVAHNQTTHTIRNVLQIQSSSTNSSSSAPLPCRSSPGSHSHRGSSGTGPGGTKYNAGARFQNGYTGAGRAVTQVNASTTHDSFCESDDNDEFTIKRVSLQSNRARARSHSLTLGTQPRSDKLAVLETVQLHARSRHAFAQPYHGSHPVVPASANGPTFFVFSAPPLPDPPLVRRNSTSASLPSDLDHALPPAQERHLNPPHLTLSTDPVSPQSTTPPNAPFKGPESQRDVFEVLRSARNSGDPTRALAEVIRFRNAAVNPSVIEFNMAIDALCKTRRQGDPLTPILETYEDMLKHSLLPNLKTYVHLIQVLTERDQEIQKARLNLEGRNRRRAFCGMTQSSASITDDERIAQLTSENNFPLAVSLFEAVTAREDLKLPLTIYQNLLRSCSYHSNVDAAIHVFAQLEARRDLLPNAAVYGHLISLYANVRDLQGAQEVFGEFREASKLGRIGWASQPHSQESSGSHADHQRQNLARSSQLVVWNKMIEAYLRCGQPAGALGLLEQMMDTRVDEKFGPADIPPPASSTFTEIIAGFCQSGDIQTALIWFDRLLQQQETGRDPYEPSTIPPRPDQIAWGVIFDNLATTGMVEDLNRLFATLLDNASRDGLEVRMIDRALVFHANIKFVDSIPSDDAAVENLDFVTNHVVLRQSTSLPLYDSTLPTMMRTVIGHYLKRNSPDKALTAVENYVDLETRTIREGESTGQIPSSQIHKKMASVRETVIETSSHLFSRKKNLSFDEALRIMRVSDKVGLLPSRAISPYYIQAYILAKNCGETRELVLRDWEILAYAVTTLELPFTKVGTTDPPQTVNYGTVSILEDLAERDIDLTTIHKSIVRRMAKALSFRYESSELPAILAKLGPDYERVLSDSVRGLQVPGDPPKDSRLAQDEAVPSLKVQISKPVHIDVYHSRFIDEFYPINRDVSPLTAYARFEAGLENNVYPIPATIGRLIGALGRLGDVNKVRKLYGDAQIVLSSLEHDKKWQSQAWFHIEDQMIIAYAHAGDLDSAHIHRARILEQGGAPTADSYGALIECVKDTTDDTSNALALFQESQMHNVPPNIYLFNNVISKLAKARKADFALELFQQMKASHIQPSSITYGAIIAACARVGDSYSAELLFSEMTMQRNFKPRVPPFNTMMQLYAHTKPNRERVLFYYNALLKANIRPTAHTYKLLIDAYGTIEPVDTESMEMVFRDLENDRNVQIQGSHWAAMINAWGGVKNDLDKAISIFESISSHPNTLQSLTILPDAVTFEALINVFVAHRRTDLIPQYIERLKSLGVHMTAYIANCLIRGYAAVGDLEQARAIFDSLLDPPEGIAAPNNHAPHEPSSSAVPATAPVYREPSTWEAMIRAELGSGYRERAIALLDGLQARKFPSAVYQRIRGIMLDDAVSPWPSEIVAQECL